MMRRNALILLISILAVTFAGVSVSITTSGITAKKSDDTAAPPKPLGPPPPLVEVARVEAQLWQNHKQVTATVKARQYLDVLSEVPGTLRQVAKAGQRLKRGEVLFHLEDRAETAKLVEKEANLALAKQNASRSDSLVFKAISEAEQQASHLDLARARSEVASLKSQLRKMRIAAPFPGVVSLHDLQSGQSLVVGQSLFSFYNPSDLYVEFHVPEQDIAALNAGVEVEVRDSVTGYQGKAEITLVNTQINSQTRTLTVRAALVDTAFRHGASVKVSYPASEPQQSLVVPQVAVNYSAYGQSVFVVKAHKAQLRSVITGKRRRGQVQILKGVAPDEIIVTAGQMRLYPNAPVRIGGAE